MFYLLENNRIIDTNNPTFKVCYTLENGITCYSIETPNEKQYHYTFGGNEYKDNTYEFHSYSIKKQSENVFDLIDWEQDLVKHSANDLIYHCVILYQTSDINANDVTAIYKPDEKGNYIKVWERKSEDDK